MNPSPLRHPADLETVRASYDAVADNYARMVVTDGMGDIRRQPWLRSAIDIFADEVSGIGPVLDVGCGPGTVTAYLAERGVDVSGIDLSPRMIANARQRHPQCRFEVGSWTELDLAPASHGGILAWWSLFNLPRELVPPVLAHCAQALRPGGQFIVATHVGDEDVQRSEAYGAVPVHWTTHRWRPEPLVELLRTSGLRPTAELRLTPPDGAGPAVVLVAQRDE
ncbi:methyltransferase [Flexivirga endophytica]|uniref:Methyltransferase n=1 Tax=Flexivirga endophytica TaxID=1849103 RepID=A0A916WRL0_9MICO|nr:class I SAM-dependent methyltransferase [Flexivirga endophytica]GGB23882.1 methyltransferase [Flexivirga endophytica]GHB57841.1 methyltransferase [Flexivirga endophytica]